MMGGDSVLLNTISNRQSPRDRVRRSRDNAYRLVGRGHGCAALVTRRWNLFVQSLEEEDG